MNRDESRVPSWETFYSLIQSGAPAVQPVPGAPVVEFFVDTAGTRIGMYARVDPSEVSRLPALDYADIKLRWVELSGKPHLELSTQAGDLFHEFFSLLLVAADLIQIEGLRPLQAVMLSLDPWRALPSSYYGKRRHAGAGCSGTAGDRHVQDQPRGARCR